MTRPRYQRRPVHLVVTDPNGRVETHRTRIFLQNGGAALIQDTRYQLYENVQFYGWPSGTYRIQLFEGPLSRRGNCEEMIDARVHRSWLNPQNRDYIGPLY